jgi:predicted ATPase
MPAIRFALAIEHTSWTPRTAVIVDEAAMLDTRLMAMVTAWAADAGAKLILAGDDRQLSSTPEQLRAFRHATASEGLALIDGQAGTGKSYTIAAIRQAYEIAGYRVVGLAPTNAVAQDMRPGGMFGALKDRHGAAALSKVKRQYKNDERRAAEMIADRNFHDALGIYERKGAIHWTRTQGQARAELVEQWARDSAEHPDKTRFVFAYTNADVATLNAAQGRDRTRAANGAHRRAPRGLDVPPRDAARSGPGAHAARTGGVAPAEPRTLRNLANRRFCASRQPWSSCACDRDDAKRGHPVLQGSPTAAHQPLAAIGRAAAHVDRQFGALGARL